LSNFWIELRSLIQACCERTNSSQFEESRVAELGWLSPDCTTSTPDIRVVKTPSHGELRFEQAKAVVSADQTALQKQCRGKPVDALRVYSKANTDYTGVDAFTIDVDAKLGFVKRYAFTMDIR